MSRQPGFFVSFEGVDGAGKSTQIARLAGHLRERGHEVLVLRPGDTAAGHAMDALLLASPDAAPMDPWTEALLFIAQRVELWHEQVRPALLRPGVVIVDRWADSTLAYQGGGRGLDRELLRALHRVAVNDATPDLTILLHVPLDVAATRRDAARPEQDRIAAAGGGFFAAVQRAFADLAAEEPGRFAVVDAGQPVETVGRAVAAAVERGLRAHVGEAVRAE